MASPSKPRAITAKTKKRSKVRGTVSRRKVEVSRGGEGDLGEITVTDDDLEEVRKQLVRSGRTSGARLTVRINGA
jgi:hypothetical protein